jgi:hypothetical protein
VNLGEGRWRKGVLVFAPMVAALPLPPMVADFPPALMVAALPPAGKGAPAPIAVIMLPKLRGLGGAKPQEKIESGESADDARGS